MDDILQHTVKQWNILILIQWKKVSSKWAYKDLQKEINKKTTNNSRKTKTCDKSNYSKIKIYSKKSLRNLYEKEN